MSLSKKILVLTALSLAITVCKGVSIRLYPKISKTIITKKALADTPFTIARPATAAKFMKALFGNYSYNAKSKTSTWACNSAILLKKFNVPMRTPFVVKVVLIDSVSINNAKVLYIITSSRPVGNNFNCHGCDVQLQFYQFGTVAATGRWAQIDHKMIDEMGSYGEAPPIELKKIGKDKYGFLFRPGFTGQGITTESVYLYTNRFDGFKQILKIEDAAMDNSGACDDKTPGNCWQYKYTLNVIDGQQPYNDLVFTQNGTREENGKKVSANKTVKYHFAAIGYTAVK